MLSKKRVLLIATGFFVLLLFIIYRLADIQLISTESFSKNHINLIEKSVEQRTHRFTINDGRGYFVDRNGELLSTDVKPEVVVFPYLFRKDWPIQKISLILHIEEETFVKSVNSLKKPSALPLEKELTMEQVNEINELKVPGLYAELVTRRKPMHFANHLIGAVGEDPDLIKRKYPEKLNKGTISLSAKTGKNGLQYTFDPFLMSDGDTELIYHVDRHGHPLFGLDVKYRSQTNPLYPLYVKTTIQKQMQQVLERYLDFYQIENGGAVLLDIDSNELLGMASRPLFTSETIYKNKNEMTSLQIPGSVFKIVTAAAAIERNKVQNGRLYNCNLNIYGEEDERKLGPLTFEQSFSASCNRTFGELANELSKSDPKFIEEYATKIGLLQPNGWSGEVYHLNDFTHFYREETGQIYHLNKEKQNYQSPLAISQTAIGQLDVKVTPLAVANMMATIARGGKWMEVKAAESVNFANGTELVTFPDHIGDFKTFSPYTIMKLQSMLSGVVRDEIGTGRSLQNLPFLVAGKTGTAEKKTNSHVYNSWFAGYFPADHPKYALVVVDLKQNAENKTTPAFADISKTIMTFPSN